MMGGEAIRVSGSMPDVCDFLKDAMQSQKFADVALCCPGGQRFLAHRLVLSAASPYLQDVLLAHSKATEYCEPITVILAEIEGPELAALLSFVYTGSATIPRPHLDAFLRAAEALHIKLPPLPVVMTNSKSGEQEARDVKINATYLQCDQYPCCEGCFDEKPRFSRGVAAAPLATNLSSYGSFAEDEEAAISRKPIYPSSPSSRSSVRLELLDSSLQPSPHNSILLAYESAARFSCPEKDQRYDSLLPKNPTSSSFSSSLASPRNPRQGQFLKSFSNEAITNCNFSMMKRPIDDDDRNDDSKTTATMKVSFRQTKTIRESSEMAAEKYESSKLDVALFEQPRVLSAPCSRDQGPVIEKPPMSPEIGENLSCKENCCRWSSPSSRRHIVANQVTASPWKQVMRPHHSPKLRPAVNSPTEPYEMSEKSSSSAISRLLSDDDRSSKTVQAQNRFYSFQYPRLVEKTSRGSDAEATKTDSYRITPRTIGDIPILPIPVNPSNGPQEQSLQSPLSELESPLPATTTTKFVEDEGSCHFQGDMIASSMPPVNQKAIVPHASRNDCGKQPELSHPISRLCEPAQPKKLAMLHSARTAESKLAEEEICAPAGAPEKSMNPTVSPLSDSNNNSESTVVINDGSRPRTDSGNDDAKHLRCDQCGKTFVTRASLKVHSRTHSGEKPFRCADCGKQFSQLRNFKYHRSVHEGTREFAATCPECGKYFNDRGYLSSHMKIHRNRKEYGCGECGARFNQRVAYNMHVRIHTGVKPHQCEQCGKAFSRKMLLKQHSRTHSGERPYQCQVCHKAFADRSNMTLHTRLHSGLKPYECTLCSKAFTKKHHLKTHLNYHTGTKPYACPNCGLCFSQSSNMRTHYKKCSLNKPLNKEVRPYVAAVAVADRGIKCAITPRAIADPETSKVKVVAALTPPTSDQESNNHITSPLARSVRVKVQ